MDINQLIGIILVVIIVSIIVMVSIIFTLGRNDTNIGPPLPTADNNDTPLPRFTGSQIPNDSNLPLPNFGKSEKIQGVIAGIGPGIVWDAALQKGFAISIESLLIVNVFFLTMVDNLIVLDDKNLGFNIPGLSFYNGTNLHLFYDNNSNSYIALVSGIDITTGGGKVLYYILSQDRETWIQPSQHSIQFSPEPTTGDQFGKSMAIMFNLASPTTFLCFGASKGFTNPVGSVQIFTFELPNVINLVTVIETEDLFTQNSTVGFANSLVSLNNKLIIGCPGFDYSLSPSSTDVQTGGCKCSSDTIPVGKYGKIYYFVYNFTGTSSGAPQATFASPWEQFPSICGCNETSAGQLGTSLAINDTGTVLISSSPGSTMTSGNDSFENSGKITVYQLNDSANWQATSIVTAPQPVGGVASQANIFFGASITGISDLRYIAVSNFSLAQPVFQYCWIYRLDVESLTTKQLFSGNSSAEFGDPGDPQAVNSKSISPDTVTPNIMFPQSTMSISLDTINQTSVFAGWQSETNEIQFFINNVADS
jgi:hypothetical protein